MSLRGSDSLSFSSLIVFTSVNSQPQSLEIKSFEIKKRIKITFLIHFFNIVWKKSKYKSLFLVLKLLYYLDMKKILLIILVSFFTLTIYTGELDDFEKGIWDTNAPDSDTSNNSSSVDGDDCLDAVCTVCGSEAGQQCLILTFGGIVHGGALSYDIATSGGKEKKRKNGTFILPQFRLDTNISYVSENVYSINNRLEAGFGPIAFDANYNLYKEKNFSNDGLNVIDTSLIYRMAFTRDIEVDLSLGISTLAGNFSLTGFKLGLPVKFKTSKRWGVEFRPSMIFLENSSVFDFDASVLWSMRYFGFTAGYKVYGNDNNYLHGPYIGVRSFY